MDEIPSRHRKKQRKPNIRVTETNEGNRNEATATEYNEKFSKRELLSNWDKYDDDISPHSSHNDAQQAPDFEELLSKPASVGGHFQFNSEKGWESSDDWYNRDDYFRLNLIELSKSLATIPFYLRQGYPQDIFSSEEIDDMDRQAKYQLFRWQSAAKGNDTLNSGSDMDVKCETYMKPSTIDRASHNDDDDDLDELLKITGSGQQKIQSSACASSTNQSSMVSNVAIQSVQIPNAADSTDDIQKWLDDVLVLDS